MDTWEGESRALGGPGEEEDPAGESFRMISTSRDKLNGKLRLAGSPERRLALLPLLPLLPPPLLLLPLLPVFELVRVVPRPKRVNEN